MDKKHGSSAEKVRDLVNQIRNDDSDFQSSGDGFYLKKFDLDELYSASSECESYTSDDFKTVNQLKKLKT